MRSIAMAAIALMCGTSALAQTNETPSATDPAATATTPPADSSATSPSGASGATSSSPPASASMAGQASSSGTVDIAAADKDKDGALSPLEFAQQMTSMSGDSSMPSKAERDRRGRASGNSAVKLLNATAADFSKADKNMDRRVDPTELAMMQSGGMSSSTGMPSSAPLTSGAGSASPAPSTSDTTTSNSGATMSPSSPGSSTPSEQPSPDTKDDMQNSTDPNESTTTPPPSR